jgi:hypothetical protein
MEPERGDEDNGNNNVFLSRMKKIMKKIMKKSKKKMIPGVKKMQRITTTMLLIQTL